MWSSDEQILVVKIWNALRRKARPAQRFVRRQMYRLEAWYIRVKTLDPFYPWDWRDDYNLEEDSWFGKRQKWVGAPHIPPKPYRQFHIDKSTLSRRTPYVVPKQGWNSASDAPDEGDAVYFPEHDIQEHLKYIRRRTYDY